MICCVAKISLLVVWYSRNPKGITPQSEPRREDYTTPGRQKQPFYVGSWQQTQAYKHTLIHGSRLCLLRASEGPEVISIRSLPPPSTAVAVIQERLCSGLDPEPYMFDWQSCLDVGVPCGGWGQAFFKIYPVRRQDGRAIRG